MFVLVAADAGQALAGVNVGVGAHRLDGQAGFVEQLEIDGRARGEAEMDAAVGFDRDGAQDAAAEGLGGDPDVGIILEGIVLGEDVDHAKGFDFDPGRPGQFALIDVQDSDGAIGQLAVGWEGRGGLGRRGGAKRGGGGTAGGGSSAVAVGFGLEGGGGEDRRTAAGPQGDWIQAGESRVAVNQFAVAEGVEEIEAVVALPRIIDAEEEVLAQRPRGAIDLTGRGMAAFVVGHARSGFGFRPEDLRGDTAELGGGAVVLEAWVDQDDRAVGLAVMRGGHGNVAVRARDGADGHFHPGTQLTAFRIIAVGAAGITAVRVAEPEMLGDIGVAINVIPAGIGEETVVIHAGMPFLGVVPAQLNHVGAVGHHGVQGGGGKRAHATADLAAGALRDEGDAVVGQKTRIVVVPEAVGQLAQVGTVGPGPEDMVGAFGAEEMVGRTLVARDVLLPPVLLGEGSPGGHLMLRFAEGEENGLGVVVQVQADESAALVENPALQASLPHGGGGEQTAHAGAVVEGLFQHADAAGLLGVEAEVLVHHVAVAADLLVVGQEEDGLEIEQRIPESDPATQGDELGEESSLGGEGGIRGAGRAGVLRSGGWHKREAGLCGSGR